MSLSRLFFLISTLCLFLTLTFPVSAQEAKEQEEAVYLDEPAEQPPARETKRQKVEVKYDNGQVRFERNVVILSDETFQNDGDYIEYYPDGQKFTEGKYVKGVMQGEWTYWHPNGQLCKKITFKDGKPDGSYEVFRSDGTLDSIQSFKAGVRDGEWKSFYDDGKSPKVTVTIKDGKVVGERTVYHPNGKIKQQSYFNDGVLDGVATEFDETGKKTAEATYKAGKLQGQRQTFQ
jgi:antitoxin component YwqK of YwqJK toxin-antitoxin module